MEPDMRKPKPSRTRQDQASGSISDFANSLPMALLRAREASMLYFQPSLRTHALTGQQWRVLKALWRRGDMEVLGLARAAFLQPPSLSRILTKLDERGLCTRRVVKTDLRRTLVSLTPHGIALLKKIEPESRKAHERIAEKFGQARLESLISLALELEHALSGEALIESTGTKAPARDERAKSGTRTAAGTALSLPQSVAPKLTKLKTHAARPKRQMPRKTQAL
jgi:homoprotocatechuate degradation regulator HpaR